MWKKKNAEMLQIGSEESDPEKTGEDPLAQKREKEVRTGSRKEKRLIGEGCG